MEIKEEKSKKGLIIFAFVCLSLLVVFFGGYFVYDKFIVESEIEEKINNNNLDNDNINNDYNNQNNNKDESNNENDNNNFPIVGNEVLISDVKNKMVGTWQFSVCAHGYNVCGGYKFLSNDSVIFIPDVIELGITEKDFRMGTYTIKKENSELYTVVVTSKLFDDDPSRTYDIFLKYDYENDKLGVLRHDSTSEVRSWLKKQ